MGVGMYESDLTIKVQEVGTTIYNLQSEQNPLTRLIKTAERPKQMLSEWNAEVYPDDAYGGTLDGTDKADLSDYDHTAREKLEAYAQYQQSPGWHVSRLTAETMTPENLRNEKGYQAKKDGIRFALMIEKLIGSDQDTGAESGLTPYKTRGIFSWLQATAQSTKPVPASFRPSSSAVYTGALASLTATAFEAMLSAAAEQINQAVNLTMPCGLKLKRQMSVWLQRDTEASASEQVTQQYNLSANDKKLLQICNRFEFDAGIVTNMTHFHLLTDATGASTAYGPRSGALMDLRMWDIGYFIPVRHQSNPDLGGGPRGFHEASLILRCRNPMGQGMVKTNS